MQYNINKVFYFQSVLGKDALLLFGVFTSVYCASGTFSSDIKRFPKLQNKAMDLCFQIVV